MHVSNEGLPAILVPLGYSEKKEFIFHATNGRRRLHRPWGDTEEISVHLQEKAENNDH